MLCWEITGHAGRGLLYSHEVGAPQEGGPRTKSARSLSGLCPLPHCPLEGFSVPASACWGGPFAVGTTARLPSGLEPCSEPPDFPQGSRSRKVSPKMGQTSKPLWIEVYLPFLAPELWHSKFVFRTRKGGPGGVPSPEFLLTFSFLLTLLYLSCPVSSPPPSKLPLLCR